MDCVDGHPQCDVINTTANGTFSHSFTAFIFATSFFCILLRYFHVHTGVALTPPRRSRDREEEGSSSLRPWQKEETGDFGFSSRHRFNHPGLLVYLTLSDLSPEIPPS